MYVIVIIIIDRFKEKKKPEWIIRIEGEELFVLQMQIHVWTWRFVWDDSYSYTF